MKGKPTLKYFRRSKIFANRVRVLRAERHITQFLLAYKSGLPPSRISLIENGRMQATEKDRQRLARALKTTVDELFPPPEEQRASA